jgi:hypothetical protein
MGNVQTEVVEKIKTHILCSITFFLKNQAVYEIMWKNIVQQETSQIQYGACALHANTEGYKHTVRVCSSCFITAVLVGRTRLNVTLHAH